MNQATPSHQPSVLFNRERLRANRARAEHNFTQHNVLFEEVTAQLLERLTGINRPFNRILDLGSRNYTLSKMLAKDDANRFILHGHTTPDIHKLFNQHVCVLDEEWLPFRASAFDLIVSNLSLHWANDLPGAMIQIRQALKPDGFFLCALFGGETLHELRTCLYDAEMTIRGGVSQHISPFADVQDCGKLLQRAGFTLPVVDKERFTLTFRDSFQLMREVRGMGEGNILAQRDKRFMPRSLFHETQRLYENRYGDGLGNIHATFDILFMAGWSPHDNQQKPLKPGQAKLSLADALHTQEKPLGEKTQP